MSVIETLTAEANTTVASHWQPEGAPWRRICVRCTDAGCPAYAEAMQQLLDLRARLAGAGGQR